MLCLFRQLFEFISYIHSTVKPKSEKSHQPYIHRLPVELVFMIASKLPSSSRACLTLSSKHLFSILSKSLEDLADQPIGSQQIWMNDLQIDRPERWNFFCMLESDISKEWRVCSKCFIFHPVGWFTKQQLLQQPRKRSCGTRKHRFGLARNQGPHRNHRSPHICEVGVCEETNP